MWIITSMILNPDINKTNEAKAKICEINYDTNEKIVFNIWDNINTKEEWIASFYDYIKENPKHKIDWDIDWDWDIDIDEAKKTLKETDNNIEKIKFLLTLYYEWYSDILDSLKKELTFPPEILKVLNWPDKIDSLNTLLIENWFNNFEYNWNEIIITTRWYRKIIITQSDEWDYYINWLPSWPDNDEIVMVITEKNYNNNLRYIKNKKNNNDPVNTKRNINNLQENYPDISFEMNWYTFNYDAITNSTKIIGLKTKEINALIINGYDQSDINIFKMTKKEKDIFFKTIEESTDIVRQDKLKEEQQEKINKQQEKEKEYEKNLDNSLKTNTKWEKTFFSEKIANPTNKQIKKANNKYQHPFSKYLYLTWDKTSAKLSQRKDWSFNNPFSWYFETINWKEIPLNLWNTGWKKVYKPTTTERMIRDAESWNYILSNELLWLIFEIIDKWENAIIITSETIYITISPKKNEITIKWEYTKETTITINLK